MVKLTNKRFSRERQHRQPSPFVSVQPPREHTTLKGGDDDAGDEKTDEKDDCVVVIIFKTLIVKVKQYQMIKSSLIS